jgi:hypothetical protein
MKRAALIDGWYRYTLSRQWDDTKPGIAWIMLNPSTANGEHDDPTIRRIIDFSQRWGFGTLNVVNLFAYRATAPCELTSTKIDPVGPLNDSAISHVCSISSAIVLAWGTNPFALRRVEAVWGLVSRFPIMKGCLGTTKNGSPRHPLYVPKDTKVHPWRLHVPSALSNSGEGKP